MIASLTGTVLSTGIDVVVIEVGGVGLRLLVTPETVAQSRTGTHVSLSTSLVVREDSLTLYGFLAPAERDAFQILQSVSGIGPRIAMAALATYSADELRLIVFRSDEAALTRISGIGKKGAQRLILELADKLGPQTGVPANSVLSVASGRNVGGWQSQVREALIGLGWSSREADEAVLVAEQDVDSGAEVSVSEMLAHALRGMNRP